MSDNSNQNEPSPFSVLGMKPAFQIDMAALNEAYFTRQVLAHPDRFIYGPDAQRLAASRESSTINDAYETLKNPVSRAKALLKLNGFEVPGEDQTVQNPEILSEMMDLQEMVQAAISPRDYKILENKLHARLEEVMEALTEAFDNPHSLKWSVPEFHREDLTMHYLRLSYLTRIRKNIRLGHRQSLQKIM